jgi:hypothetical protein
MGTGGGSWGGHSQAESHAPIAAEPQPKKSARDFLRRAARPRARRTLAHRLTGAPGHLLSPTEQLTRRRQPLRDHPFWTAPESPGHMATWPHAHQAPRARQCHTVPTHPAPAYRLASAAGSAVPGSARPCHTAPPAPVTWPHGHRLTRPQTPLQSFRAADALRGHPWPGTVAPARATAATRSPRRTPWARAGGAAGSGRFSPDEPPVIGVADRSRRRRNQERRRGPFGAANGPRGGALGRGAEVASTAAPLAGLPPPRAACPQQALYPTGHVARRAKTLGVSSISRRSRKRHSRRRPFGPVHRPRGWALGRGAERAPTTVPLAELAPSGAARRPQRLAAS